jgi:hypothetical protein
MTLTSTRPLRPASADPEALIREARRFQRRRWWGRGALTLALVLLVTGIMVVSSRHGGAPPPVLQPFRPDPPPAAHVVTGPSLGSATAFALTGPTSVAVDGADNVFFTDGNRVFEVPAATGQMLVVAGTGVNGFSGDGGPAQAAELSFPSSLTLGPDGDLYFVDGGNRIRKVSAATGAISTVAGDGLLGDAGVGGGAVRADLDLNAGTTRALSLDGPIAVGPNGDLYIAEGAQGKILKVSSATGTITDVAGTTPGCPPEGLVVDRASDLFVTTGCDAVTEVSARTGAHSALFGLHQVPSLATEGTTSEPVDLGMGANGDLFVIASDSRSVYEISPKTDRVILRAGTGSETVWAPGATAGDGGPASEATFGLVGGLTVGSGGRIYLADSFDNAIREIDPRTGLISLLAGQIPTSPAVGHCC